MSQALAKNPRAQHLSPAKLSPLNAQVVKAWNRMGGVIEWSAVPLMIELHSIADQDVVDFLDRLEQIRNYNAEANSG